MLRYRLICLCLLFAVLSFGWQASAQDGTPTEEPPTEAAPLPTEDPVIPLVTDEPVPIIPTEEIILLTEEPAPIVTEEIVTPAATEEMITPVPVTPSPTLAPDPLTPVFSTTFDAPAPEFPFGMGWTEITVENGLALQSGPGDTLSVYNTAFLDAAIRVRVLFGSGVLTLTLRDSSTETAISRYSATLAQDGTLTLWRNDSTLAATTLFLPDGEWTALELRAIGAQITVLVNGIETLTAADPEPLPLGRISLSTALDSVLRVDDLAVLAQGEGVLIVLSVTPTPTETPTLVPTVDVPDSITPDATVEPTAEATEVELALPQGALPQAGPIGAGPTITSPINASLINDNTPALNWGQVPTASSYTLQIATNATFTANLQTFSGITNAQLPYSLPVLADSAYFTRVQTHTPPSNFTNFGPVSRFTLDTVAPTQSVIPLTPAKFARIPTLRPAFTWPMVSDAKDYQVQVDSLGTFVGGTGDLYNSPFVSRTTYTILPTEPALKQGTLYFRVLPRDAAGNVGTGRIVMFSTVLALTPTTETVVSTPRPLFTWAAVAGTGMTYTLQVAKNSTFTDIILEKPNLTTTRYLPTANLDAAPGGVRYWRILPNGALPIGPGGYIRFILNLVPLPAAPVLSAPPALTNDNTPNIVWNTALNAVSYEFQVSETRTFTTYPAYANTAINPNAAVMTPLPDGTYYVRVRGINSAQAPGPYSAVRTFVIDTHAPDAPTLKSPLNNAAVTGRPTFTWTALPVAQAVTSYRLDVSADNFVTTLAAYTNRTVTGVGFTAPVSVAALTNGLYQWRLRAVDSAGNISANSATGVFYVNTAALKAPVIATLEGAATGSPISNDTQPEVTFTTTNPTTLNTLNRSHEVQFSTVNTFATDKTITVSVTDLSVDDADWTVNAVTQLPNSDSQMYSVRMRTVYKNATSTAYGPFSLVRTFTLDTTVPDIPRLTAPVNGAVVTTPRPAFKWLVSSGAVSYRLDVSLNNFTSTLPAYTNRTVTGLTFTAPASVAALASGLYQWQLRAVDAAGNVSDDSLPGMFYVNATVLTAPVIATLEDAAIGSPASKDTQPEATLTTTNPAALSTLTGSHEVQFSTTKTFANPVIVITTDLSLDDADWSSVVLPGTAGQIYYVRAQTVYKDANNTLYGPFSAVRSFTLDTTAPQTPIVLTPTGTITSLKPTITWKPSATTKLYSIYDTTQATTTLLGTSPTTRFVVPNNLTQGTHTITVLAEDVVGNISTEISANNKTFEIFIGTTPAAGTTLVRTGASVPVPFAWTPIVGATSYTLQISTVKDDFTAVQPVTLPTPTSTKVTVSLPNGADYYWRVLVNNAPLPDTVHHTLILVAGVLPPATLNTVETDNMINQADDSNGITFTWNAPAVVAGVSVSGYRVQTSTLATFPPASTITSANLGLVTTYTAPANTLPETTKFWRVVTQYASDGGTNINSAVRQLTIDRTAPKAPTISLPAANAVLSTTRPTIGWAASATATSYRLDIATDSGFTAFVPQYANRTVPGISLILPSSLPQQTLYVRVRAVDAAGNISLDSLTRSFGVFIGTGPAQSLVSSDTTPTFTWVAIPGATAYTVQVDVDGNFSPSTYTFSVNAPATTLTVPSAQPLPSGAAYVWRVIPAGDTSSTGLMRTLIISAPLTAPNLISPMNSSFINGND